MQGAVRSTANTAIIQKPAALFCADICMLLNHLSTGCEGGKGLRFVQITLPYTQKNLKRGKLIINSHESPKRIARISLLQPSTGGTKQQ